MTVELSSVKIERLRGADLESANLSLSRRLRRVYAGFAQDHSAPVALILLLSFCVARALGGGAGLRRSAGRPAAFGQPTPERSFDALIDRAGPRDMIYAVRITGGIGDAIVVARLIRDLQNEFGGGAKFDVYYQSPEAVRPFFATIPGFHEIIHVETFESTVPYYIFSIIAHQMVLFADEHMNHRVLLREFPVVLKLFKNVQSFRKPFDKYIAVHPYLDGAFADYATRQGFSRNMFLHKMMGIAYGGDRLAVPVDPAAPAAFGLTPGRYITVHDGWDAKFKLATHRPTKAMPEQSWIDIVKHLKALRPDLTIVQLGGKPGADIRGVDVNLKNRLSFAQSTSILAHAAVHIDTESGLVHVAASLGVRSVVMFGPTNVGWFGYPQNANIEPRQCGNCWWSTDSWMDACPVGHEQPVCTASIDPRDVAMRAVAIYESCDRGLEPILGHPTTEEFPVRHRPNTQAVRR